MADKDLKIRISGDSRQLGAESQKAVSMLNELKSAAAGVAAGLTGGIIGGGIAGALSGIVSVVTEQLRNARQLLVDARNLDVSPSFLRGARQLSGYLTGSPDSIEQAVAQARKIRADAIYGDPNATKAADRLGVSAVSLAGLNKQELFEAIIEAFRRGPDTRERRVALADFFGDGPANALLPYIVGKAGAQANFRELLQGEAFPWQMQGASRYNPLGGGPGQNMLSRDQFDAVYRGAVEPISRAGLANEEVTERLRMANDERELALKRELMTVEERLTSIAERRKAIEQQIATDTDSAKQEKLRGALLDLAAEEVQIQRLQGAGGGAQSLASLRAAAVPQDEFAQRGLFIGGGPTQQSQQQQLQSLHAIEARVRELVQVTRETF